jgi:hypothetical protein
MVLSDISDVFASSGWKTADFAGGTLISQDKEPIAGSDPDIVSRIREKKLHVL